MDNSEQQIIDLGHKIATDLDLHSHSDFLGGWMAHYIAELITNYDHAEGATKQKIGLKAFDAILKLWKHRYKTSSGFDSLKQSKTILETLKKLDPNQKRPFYFAFSKQRKQEPKDQLDQFQELATEVDFTARKILKSIILVMAEISVDDDARDYLNLIMPEHLTSDLEAFKRLVEDTESDVFPNNLEHLQHQINDFGHFCIDFAKLKKE